MLPNGYKGRIANFDIWMSNNLPSESAAEAIWIGGHPLGISFVDSLNSIEAYRPEQLFGDAVKGIYVYGAAAVLNDALVAVYTARA
jgi:hypothetical protein